MTRRAVIPPQKERERPLRSQKTGSSTGKGGEKLSSNGKNATGEGSANGKREDSTAREGLPRRVRVSLTSRRGVGS